MTQMNTEFATARIYTDMNGLADLKLSAKNEDAGSLEEAAKQFESLFVHMMLKSMREATLKSELLGSDQMQFQQEMFDQQLALELGSKKSLGIADMLIRQLGGQANKSDRPSPFHEMVPAPSRTSESDAVVDQVPESEPDRFDSPEEFIEYMRPLAEKAAHRLGIDPDVLIAQSALETGWGKKIIRGSDGNSSHNLFGIKAHRNWQGSTTRVNTLEYIGGTMRKTRDEFRAYESFADSFEDYVDFLLSNPRYQDAVHNSNSSNDFISGLQTAGYATDPEYASKIINILDRDVI